VVERHASDKEAGVAEYFLTPMGRELEPIVMGIGRWGQRWIRSDLSLQQLDGGLLMWDLRRNLKITQPPPVRKVIKLKSPTRRRGTATGGSCWRPTAPSTCARSIRGTTWTSM
jgi:hypothetical protein